MNDDYFGWLCSLTARPRNRNPHRTYWQLLHQLHLKPFRWLIEKDGNRDEDGKELRKEYLDQANIAEGDEMFLVMESSMLEMLIALARRTSFESYAEPADWFWKILENLDMRHYNDANYNDAISDEVDETLERILDRDYSYDGVGGMFPLRRATTDQRRTEIRYQMAAYIIEGWEVANGP